MIEPWRYTRPFPRPTPFCTWFFAAAISLGASLYFSSSVTAQTEPITVDLSVIQDGGVSAFGPISRGGLLVPPKSNPVSELHIAPNRAPNLRVPMAEVTKTPRTNRPVIVKKPAPAMTAKVAPAKAAPKPMPAQKVVKAEIAPAPAPALPQAPKEMPKSAPAPAEKPVAEKMPEPKVEPAKVSDAPPPPPKVAEVSAPVAPAEQASTGSQAVAIAPGQAMRIEFAEAETKLPDAMKDALRKIADGVHDKQDLRLQLMAYAGADGLSASKARRLSLSRALSVRSFLIESGVRSTRIDVRALGNKTSDKPANRVDVNIAKR